MGLSRRKFLAWYTAVTGGAGTAVQDYPDGDKGRHHPLSRAAGKTADLQIAGDLRDVYWRVNGLVMLPA